MTDAAAIREMLRDLQARQEALERKLDRLLVGDTLDTLTTKEVCQILRIGTTKLKRLIASGELPMWKLGGERRITRAELEAFVREQATASGQPSAVSNQETVT